MVDRRFCPVVLAFQVLLVVLCCGCGREAATESFYKPPDAKARAAVTLEPASETCKRWQQTKFAQESGGATAVAETLQQQFLLFGLEEIRVDPLTPLANGNQKHITASVRGLSQDTILVLTENPANEHGSLAPLAPLAAVAKYWSVHADPQNPPALTMRFGVLPGSETLSADQVVAGYLAQRPRMIGRIKAIVILDPASGTGLYTNRGPLRDGLSETATMNGVDITIQGPHSAATGGLAAAFSRLDLPSIWMDLGWQEGREGCSKRAVESLARASQLLLEILRALVSAEPA